MNIPVLPGCIICVVGARPNFMKIAPIIRAMRATVPPIPLLLVHTGQHYDAAMNTQYFEALRIPDPDINLEVGSGSHAVQTAQIMQRFEPVVDRAQPAAVLVVGDVNSTVACALVAVKKGCPVIHVEAGLRSFDRTMPEEINRVVTDQISEILYTSERSALDNLAREGIPASRIHLVGNVMIDTLRENLALAVPAAQTLHGQRHLAAADESGFAVLTLHRPSNVDDPVVLRSLLTTMGEISRRLPIAFTLHPRTRSKIEQYGLQSLLDSGALMQLPPQGYLEMLGLMRSARLVLTDSGGIQEETTALGVPCVTLRENTERPVTVDEGTNTIAGQDSERILAITDEILRTGGKKGRIPELWDGHAARRIAESLRRWLDRAPLDRAA
ncbi:MAG: UDP-N-acetylglucosamine 2-epimerase (non-hydrolyzing) [Betaproteobacteria bacterium]